MSRVSVIIPAFNSERFIADAVASVLAQSVRPDEVFVVDDGSTDRTAEIAAGFAGVRIIADGHHGVSTARNRGVAASQSDFIAFLDSDDIWMPAKLHLQLKRFRQEAGVGIVVSRQSYRFDVSVPNWFRGPTNGSSEPGYMPSNWLLSRETWERVGPFDPRLTHSEDTDWLARANDAGVKTVMVDEPLVVHRIHETNASGMAAPVRANVLRTLRDSVQRKRGQL